MDRDPRFKQLMTVPTVLLASVGPMSSAGLITGRVFLQF
jgi:hypothetical protein